MSYTNTAAARVVAAAAAMMPLAPAAAQLTPGARYVPIGSSYAAGPGVGTPDSAAARRAERNRS